MTFVAINNLEIPVVAGGELTPAEIGQQGRVYSGGYLRNRRAIKRRWRFRTSVVDDAFAQAIIGMIQGRGHLFTFDDTSTDPVEAADNDSTVSGSGLVPSTLTGCTIHSNTAVDGNSVANVYTAPATTNSAAARTQALGVYSTSNNELPASQRIGDHSGANPFNALNGGVLSNEVTKVFSESADKHSLKVEAGAANRGAKTDTITVIAGETWTGSVYLLGDSGGESVIVRVFDNSGGADETAVTVTLSATEWRRVWVTHTVDAGGTAVLLDVRSAAGAPTFYGDNWQLEEKAYPTAWYNGNRSSADDCVYDGTFLQGAPGITVAGWSNGSASAAAGTASHICTFGADADNRQTIYYDTSARLSVLTRYGATTQDSGSISGAALYGQWWHFAAVWDVDAATVKLYKNGTLGDTLTGVTLPTSVIDTINMGSAFSGSQLNGEIDDVLVVPYIMDTNMITALYNSGTAPTIGNHRLILSGDCIPDSSVTVVGKVNSASFKPAHQSSWQENNRVIDFTLYEV